TDGQDRLLVEATSLQPDRVDAASFRRRAADNQVGGHIIADMGHAADHRVGPDLEELVDASVSAQQRPVTHFHVARDADVVGKYRMVADHAVVGNMDVRHQQVVVTDARVSAAKASAPVQGAASADDIVRTDLQPGFLAFELLVGRVLTDGGKLVDPVVAANAGIGLDHHMRGDLCACADLDAGTDNAPRTDLDVVRESGTGINDGSRIN